MSAEARQPTDNSDLVRKLVVPSEPQVESQDSDRTPKKTERDLITDVSIEADTMAPNEDEAIEKLVTPELQSESE